jgi:hypothetical protein
MDNGPHGPALMKYIDEQLAARGISRNQLANQGGFTPQFTRWADGEFEPTLIKMQEIADGFGPGVTLADLLIAGGYIEREHLSRPPEPTQLSVAEALRLAGVDDNESGLLLETLDRFREATKLASGPRIKRTKTYRRMEASVTSR